MYLPILLPAVVPILHQEVDTPAELVECVKSNHPLFHPKNNNNSTSNSTTRGNVTRKEKRRQLRFNSILRWENGRNSSHTRPILEMLVPKEAQDDALSNGMGGGRRIPPQEPIDKRREEASMSDVFLFFFLLSFCDCRTSVNTLHHKLTHSQIQDCLGHKNTLFANL
jgi:hypothetical protein